MINENNFEDEDIPNKIEDKYKNDYNITYIDNIIKKKIKNEKNKTLKEHYKTLEQLKKDIKKPQIIINKNIIKKSIEELTENIKLIESGEKLKEYINKTENLINEYIKCEKPKVIVFDEEDTVIENDESTKKRLRIISEYLKIASNYIELNIIKINNNSPNICNVCGNILETTSYIEEIFIKCKYCNSEYELYNFNTKNKENDKITNNGDESIENFIKALYRYQGLQKDRPPKILYEKLDEYFKSINKMTGEEIRKLPLNEFGRKDGTNHKMIWNALSHINYTNHYEDANLIGHIYWGWELKNIKHLEEKIIDKYYKTQKVFYSIPYQERERDSSLGTQYRLWKHLQLEGVKCSINEFKIAENIESLRNHNKLWKIMCEGCNSPDIYYIE